MKIGFDSKRAYLNNTGLGNYSRDSIRILEEYYPSNQYFLYTPIQKNNPKLNFLNGKRHLSVRSPKSYFFKFFSSLWRTFQLTKEIVKDEVEIYHGLSHELPEKIERTNVKTIVTIHDLIFLRFPQYYGFIDREIYRYKFYHSCRIADRIIAVSEQTKSDIVEFFQIPAEKITVVYQGCHQMFQGSVSDDTKNNVRKKYQLPASFILSVGSVEERKNLLGILKSLMELDRQHLVVVGGGNTYKKSCLNFIKENGLEERVHFLSGISTEELAAVYHLADIMIYPSLFEGFGIPIIEALFCKTPVITTREGCFNESGGPSSLYVNPLEPDEISDAVKLIQRDNTLRETMILDGYNYAQRFTDEKVAENLMAVYTRLR
tara:strand:+ start:82 stop:1206 length:1125 start_codon:yes stop_codon:yes gene_type:complete